MNHATVAPLRVRVQHADALIAAGVLHSLATQPDITVVDDGTFDEADVVVTDLAAGLRLTGAPRAAPAQRPPARVLVLAAHDREFEVRRALESGVHGYLLSSCEVVELVRGIRAVGIGSRYLSVEVAQRIAESIGRDPLTAREADVLELLVRGYCNKSIARALDISIGTVKAHVKAILAKLEATSRTHAVSVAVARGWLREQRAA